MQSVGRIVKNPFEIADGNSDAIRIFSFLKNALSFDHIFSIGFRSGLYGGKYRQVTFELSSSCFTHLFFQAVNSTGIHRKTLCDFFCIVRFIPSFNKQFSCFIMQHNNHLLTLSQTCCQECAVFFGSAIRNILNLQTVTVASKHAVVTRKPSLLPYDPDRYLAHTHRFKAIYTGRFS